MSTFAAVAAELAAKLPNDDDRKKLAALLNVEEQRPWWEDPAQVKMAYEKLGPEGFKKLAEETREKVDVQKTASDFYYAGQILGRGFVDFLQKTAAENTQVKSDTSANQRLAEILGK